MREDQSKQRQEAIELWYRVFIDRNPAVTRDDIETCFDQLDETRPTAD